MRSGAYSQHRIGQGRLADFDAKYIVSVLVKPDPVGGLLKFSATMEQTTISTGLKKEIKNINVDGDTRIIVILDKSYKWRWSTRFDAVTTKEELSYYYGNLQYNRTDSTLKYYDEISFDARFDETGQQGTTHGFSFNVELLQREATTTVSALWLEITIDPDVGNPPPKSGGRIADNEDAVLYSDIGLE